MMARTFTDAAGAMVEWINGRTATLVGVGNPLQLGAYLKKLGGGEPAVYAFIEEQFSTRTTTGPENFDMLAVLSAQVYGGTRKAATDGAIALAEEISSEMEGREVTVGATILQVADDVTGPAWVPDGDKPRLLVNFTVRARPA